jgi:hypothetical protein
MRSGAPRSVTNCPSIAASFAGLVAGDELGADVAGEICRHAAGAPTQSASGSAVR